MVNLSVPDGLLRALEDIEKPVYPKNILRVLIWASKNPEEARSFAERLQRLNHLGRKEFERCIWCGNSLAQAVENAERTHEKTHRQRSLLSKFLAAVRKGRYECEMPNGVRCFAIRRNGFWFTFTPGGAEITLVVKGRCGLLAPFLEHLSEGRVASRLASEIIYNGQAYHPNSDKGEILLRAIIENMPPEVAAVVGETVAS